MITRPTREGSQKRATYTFCTSIQKIKEFVDEIEDLWARRKLAVLLLIHLLDVLDVALVVLDERLQVAIPYVHLLNNDILVNHVIN